MVEWANITWIMLHTFTVKIKENIRFTQEFLNTISIIKGIKSINYS